ncbi:MAG: DUF6588 family protein [Nonlabens sp.]
MPKKLFLLAAFIVSLNATAQTTGQDLDDVLTDLLSIFDRFTEPAAQAGIQQTAAGYYTTADTLKLFQVKLGGGLSMLPFTSSNRSFTVRDSDFKNISIVGATEATIPTALGGRDEIDLMFNLGDDEYVFEVFGGLDSEVLYMPYLQAQVGLWANTELTLRHAPKLEIEGSEYTLYGAGIRHNLSQYLFPESEYKLSLIANFNWTDLDLTIDTLELIPNNSTRPLAVLTGTLIDVYSINVGLAGSRSFNRFTVSAGVLGTSGWIDYVLTGEDTQFLRLFNRTLTALSEKKYTFTGELGLSYDLKFVEIAAQYTYSTNSNFNVAAYVKI